MVVSYRFIGKGLVEVVDNLSRDVIVLSKITLVSIENASPLEVDVWIESDDCLSYTFDTLDKANGFLNEVVNAMASVS